MSVAEIEQELVDAGAQIVWVLEADVYQTPGTAQSCYDAVGTAATLGWCVGDGQTEPEPGEWDDSPFSQNRGFDIIVPRESMTIEFTTNHGSTSGNENLDADELLAAVEEIVDAL